MRREKSKVVLARVNNSLQAMRLPASFLQLDRSQGTFEACGSFCMLRDPIGLSLAGKRAMWKRKLGPVWRGRAALQTISIAPRVLTVSYQRPGCWLTGAGFMALRGMWASQGKKAAPRFLRAQ